MTAYLISLSLLICAVLLVRSIFRKTISPGAVYALWLVVVIRLLLPFSLFQAEIEFPTVLPAARTEQSAPDTPADTVEQTSPEHPVQSTSPLHPVKSPQETSPAIPNIAWGRLVRIAWVTGSALTAVWIAGVSITFHYRLQKNRKPYRTFLGTKVFISDCIGVPCIAGLIPTIYITPAVANSRAETLILLHEHIHLRHGDPFWAALRALALIAFWWNPLVWAAASVSKRDAELACDAAIAARVNDTVRLKYARILLQTVPQKYRRAVGFGSAPIKERILMLTKKQKNSWFCLFLAVLLALSAAACSFVSLNAKTENNEENTDLPPHSQTGYSGDYEFLIADESGKVSLSYGAEDSPLHSDFAFHFRVSFGEYTADITPHPGAWLRYTWEPQIYCTDIGIPNAPVDGIEDAVVILTTATGTGIHMKEAYVLSGADGTLHTFKDPFEVIENAVQRDESGKTWIVDAAGSRIDLPDNAYFNQHFKFYMEDGQLCANISVGYGVWQYNGDYFRLEYSADGVQWSYHPPENNA